VISNTVVFFGKKPQNPKQKNKPVLAARLPERAGQVDKSQ